MQSVLSEYAIQRMLRRGVAPKAEAAAVVQSRANMPANWSYWKLWHHDGIELLRHMVSRQEIRRVF